MKKKIILALTACLFAAGSIINMHLAQNNHNTDISLADISVMAQADGENGGDDCGDPIWNVTITFRNGFMECSCTLGGTYYCCCTP